MNKKYNAKRITAIVVISTIILASVAYATIIVCSWAWGISMDYLHRLFTEATAKEYQIWFAISAVFVCICLYCMRSIIKPNVHNENCFLGRGNASKFVRKDNTSAPTNRNSGKKVTKSVVIYNVHGNDKVVSKKNIPFDFNEHDPWIYA